MEKKNNDYKEAFKGIMNSENCLLIWDSGVHISADGVGIVTLLIGLAATLCKQGIDPEIIKHCIEQGCNNYEEVIEIVSGGKKDE